MAQRVSIALALLIRPDLLIADEPTTALDLLSQIEMLALLERLREETGLSLVLVSHDLSVMRRIADRVIIMYAGRIVEEGPAGEILPPLAIPTRRDLLASALQRSDGERIYELPGTPPDLAALPAGCSFRPRCAFAFDRCGTMPALTPIGDGHRYAAICSNGRRPMPSGALLAFDQVSVVFRNRGARSAGTTALDRVSFAVVPGGSVGAIGDLVPANRRSAGSRPGWCDPLRPRHRRGHRPDRGIAARLAAGAAPCRAGVPGRARLVQPDASGGRRDRHAAGELR